jgi:hypothetical protein
MVVDEVAVACWVSPCRFKLHKSINVTMLGHLLSEREVPPSIS